VFLCGWSAFLSYSDNHVAVMDSRIDWLLRLLQAIGLLGAIGTAVLLFILVHTLPERAIPWWSKLSEALVALACLSTVWFAFSLKLLSWSLNY